MNALRSGNKWTEHWFEMDHKAKIWYSSYMHGIVHGLISTIGAHYCFIYADGKSGTTWFTDEDYWS